MEEHGKLDRGDGVRLAWGRTAGRGPMTVFLPGFRSNMAGEKAMRLQQFCAARGQAFLRFDYSGHGESDGRFEDGVIGAWAGDALLAVDRLTEGPLILVGSSMGGWIAALVARARPERLAGFIGIAAAPDFTEALLWPALPFEHRATLMQQGVIYVPSQYGDPTPITRALIEDGRDHLVFSKHLPIACPMRLLHGQRDRDVPWEMALRLAEHAASEDVRVILVKDGDHRLSRPQDLALLEATLAGLLAQDGA